ncbi:MAG: hypothetical protein E7Z97_11245 [Propionibacteriaceae bacterium]|uniref:Uncharacterized protein n=1 Tax=Propionibacterium ruminifibrarum TaxID=1962131 RepID=A0A375I3P5_9ACTN|nr:hypothetical protein [Propionibacterium ruminifibrarum]MBE6478619.1 hypothetical protein [Propionibacteriaceae bacterium]SPF68344.1 Hypothetical protein PROPJV5_1339 [Propionibacterium ruminifibrarum]
MTEPDQNEAEQFRAALARVEASRAGSLPGFETVWRSVAASVSPMDAPQWPLARGIRVTGALVLAQARVASWLIVPAALVSAALAVLAARWLGAAQGSSAVTSGFAALILAGAVVTMTMAVSRRAADSVSAATPVGPAAVLFARVTMVLIVDCLAGGAASWLATVSGSVAAFGPLVMTWLAPMVLVTGLTTLLAVWAAPWVGALVGFVTIPVLVPAPEPMVRVGLGAVLGVVHDALPSFAVVGVGAVLFTVALLTARRATAGLAAA